MVVSGVIEALLAPVLVFMVMYSPAGPKQRDQNRDPDGRNIVPVHK